MTLKSGNLRSGLRNATSADTIPDSAVHRYDATAISGSDGDAIGSWADQIGSETLNQSTSSAKPTLRTSGINNKNTVEFDGSDDVLKSGTFTSISEPWEMMLVAKLRDQSGTNVEIANGLSSGGKAWFASDNSSNEWIIGGNSDKQAGATDTNPHVFNELANDASTHLKVDGSDVITSDAEVDPADQIFVGGNVNGFYGPFDIAEFVLYDDELTSQERSDEETRLGDKWGITI